jgi:hypothetical protein
MVNRGVGASDIRVGELANSYPRLFIAESGEYKNTAVRKYLRRAWHGVVQYNPMREKHLR